MDRDLLAGRRGKSDRESGLARSGVSLGHDHVEDGERGLRGRGEDAQSEDPVAGHALGLGEAPDAVRTEEVALRGDAAQIRAEADRVNGKDVEQLHSHGPARDGGRRHGLERHQDVVEGAAAGEDIAVRALPDQGARVDAAAVVLVDEDVVRVLPAAASEHADTVDGVGILSRRRGELGGKALQVADARIAAQGATPEAVVLEEHFLGVDGCGDRRQRQGGHEPKRGNPHVTLSGLLLATRSTRTRPGGGASCPRPVRSGRRAPRRTRGQRSRCWPESARPSS